MSVVKFRPKKKGSADWLWAGYVDRPRTAEQTARQLLKSSNVLMRSLFDAEKEGQLPHDVRVAMCRMACTVEMVREFQRPAGIRIRWDPRVRQLFDELVYQFERHLKERDKKPPPPPPEPIR
jgi:hypothetical protein